MLYIFTRKPVIAEQPERRLRLAPLQRISIVYMPDPTCKMRARGAGGDVTGVRASLRLIASTPRRETRPNIARGVTPSHTGFGKSGLGVKVPGACFRLAQTVVGVAHTYRVFSCGTRGTTMQDGHRCEMRRSCATLARTHARTRARILVLV